MKILKVLLVTMVAIVALAALTATAWGQDAVNAPKSGLAGHGPHDLSSHFIGAYNYEVCDFCHVAHKTGAIGSTVGPGYLLWNHTISSVTTYGVYTSETFNALSPTISDLGANNANTTTSPLGSSNCCLSCHDGTVAENSFYVRPKGASTTYGTTVLSLKVEDLTKTHPVHFIYNAALASAAGVKTPANANSVDGAGALPLYNGYMECTTCHDVHNPTGIYPYMRLALDNYSGLGEMCNYCHI